MKDAEHEKTITIGIYAFFIMGSIATVIAFSFGPWSMGVIGFGIISAGCFISSAILVGVSAIMLRKDP